MRQMPYMAEPWFALLREACSAKGITSVAAKLGTSRPLVSQVLNGSGQYGKGQASPARLADKVLHTLGRYVCPHLTGESCASDVEITAAQCRAYAHRPPPTGSPRDMQHWQACRACMHREASAPPAPKPVQARRARKQKMEGEV